MGGERSVWVSTGRDVRDGLLSLIPTVVAVLVAAGVRADLIVDSLAPAVGAAFVVAAGDALARPALRVLAGLLGAIAALLTGVAWQVVLVWGALAFMPGVRIASLTTVGVTLLTVALIGAATRWMIGINDSSYLVADLLRRARNRRRRTGGQPHIGTSPGLVIVQIDGMPAPLLQHGIMAGTLPTLARWLRTGSHVSSTWWAQIPSTTPASQAGLLHGTSDGIPAFRWYEKDDGRLVVTNRPGDAALVEARLSDGAGLLSGGGVSISTMFSGDASTCHLVMSRAGIGDGLGPGRQYLRFFASPFVFVRALLLTVGEMVKELWQARRQRILGVEPRVSRGGAFVLLRAVTNVMLRDLNVALVAEHMMRGAPVIFVDFVDYDEIAHHAGVARPEAVDALAGLDRMLSVLEQLADAADRAYRFVVLSDHGQSQGTTFRQLEGRTLEDVVRELVGAPTGATVSSTVDAESWGPVNALLAAVLSAKRTTPRWAQRRGGEDGAGALVGPQRRQGRAPRSGDGGRPELVVVGSGNLGLVWFPRLPGRVDVEELQQRFPRLLPGVLGRAGVGFVVVDSARGPLAVGESGVYVLAEGAVEGIDPLTAFGPRAARDLLRVATMANAPDLLVHSAIEPHTLQVHAFEELVGSHGGLGGWQNLAVLVHPALWPLDADLLDESVPGERMLVGAVDVHRQLVRWLERSGIRPQTGAPLPEPSGADCAEEVA